MQKLQHTPPWPKWLCDLAKALSIDVAELHQQPAAWLDAMHTLLLGNNHDHDHR